MDLSGATKVSDIAAASTAATRILEKAGVDFCCGGQRSLQDACMSAGVSTEEMIERLRAASIQTEPGDGAWLSAPLNELTQHIRSKHHQYVREAIQHLQTLLTKVIARHGENHPELAQIESLVAAVSGDMIMHMQKEEQVLFPYIDALERAASGAGSLEPPFFQTVRNPIQSMMRDHDAAGDLLKEIRRATSDYTPPADGCVSYQALYRELHEFEQDLHQHVHLENNILFPRAVKLESGLS